MYWVTNWLLVSILLWFAVARQAGNGWCPRHITVVSRKDRSWSGIYLQLQHAFFVFNLVKIINKTIWCFRSWILCSPRCVWELCHYWFRYQRRPVVRNIGDLNVLMNRSTFKKTSIACPHCKDVFIFAQRVNWLYISYIQAYNLFNKFNESSCRLIYIYYTLRSRTDTNTISNYG